jgi:CHAT domain
VAEKIIGAQKGAFLKFEIDHGDARRRKIALQEVARLYRQRFRFNAERRNEFENAINGLVLQVGQDLKVVRWCLNVLAQLGTRGNSSRYVNLALRQYDSDAEITAAGIAALTMMYNGRVDEIESFATFDPQIRTLAALQNTPAKRLDLRGFRIEIDTAHRETLKLALITVGLNRDIENLFHPRHSNGAIVRALGQHSDNVVVQYSVWAIIENRRLSMADLGLRIRPIDRHPPNVQSKLLQLVIEREADAVERHDIVADGPFLPCLEAREGLAKGLLASYYDGLEEVTLDWFDQEPSHPVRLLLAQHFARFANECPPYEDKAIVIRETDPSYRDHLLVGSEGSPLWGKLMQLDIRTGTRDLFGELDDMVLARLRDESRRDSIVAIKVLFLAAAPLDEPRLRLDEEARDIKEQLRLVRQPTAEISIVHEWAVRTNQIQAAILNEKPDILHFSGHGSHGSLCFEDENGNSADVTETVFAELIELNRDRIKCVVLNACFSDGVAQLTKPHVRAVIGCDQSIDDGAAIAFTRGFYRALAHGRTYEQAFRLAKNEVSLMGKSAEADKYKLLS